MSDTEYQVYKEEIDRLRAKNAEYKRFITRWVEIIQGGDSRAARHKISRIEGWAQDFIHEAHRCSEHHTLTKD